MCVCVQGKRLAGSQAYDNGGDVSDEDEAANVPMDNKEGEKAPKKKEKQHIKLSQELSNITAMKSTGFKPDTSALPGQFYYPVLWFVCVCVCVFVCVFVCEYV